MTLDSESHTDRARRHLEITRLLVPRSISRGPGALRRIYYRFGFFSPDNYSYPHTRRAFHMTRRNPKPLESSQGLCKPSLFTPGGMDAQRGPGTCPRPQEVAATLPSSSFSPQSLEPRSAVIWLCHPPAERSNYLSSLDLSFPLCKWGYAGCLPGPVFGLSQCE